MQSCALAMSGPPAWQRLTFTLGRLGILGLFQSNNQMLGTLGFTGSEYWGPFNFSASTDLE